MAAGQLSSHVFSEIEIFRNREMARELILWFALDHKELGTRGCSRLLAVKVMRKPNTTAVRALIKGAIIGLSHISIYNDSFVPLSAAAWASARLFMR